MHANLPGSGGFVSKPGCDLRQRAPTEIYQTHSPRLCLPIIPDLSPPYLRVVSQLSPLLASASLSTKESLNRLKGRTLFADHHKSLIIDSQTNLRLNHSHLIVSTLDLAFYASIICLPDNYTTGQRHAQVPTLCLAKYFQYRPPSYSNPVVVPHKLTQAQVYLGQNPPRGLTHQLRFTSKIHNQRLCFLCYPSSTQISLMYMPALTASFSPPPMSTHIYSNPDFATKQSPQMGRAPTGPAHAA